MDSLKIEYWPLKKVIKKRWDENAKRHDIPMLIASFTQYGFRDPIGYDKTLKAFVEGNGRAEALMKMRADNYDPPRGIEIKNGDWMIPILIGIDAKTINEAKAYAIDHNNTTLAVGNTRQDEYMRLWDESIKETLHNLDDNIRPLTMQDYILTPIKLPNGEKKTTQGEIEDCVLVTIKLPHSIYAELSTLFSDLRKRDDVTVNIS